MNRLKFLVSVFLLGVTFYACNKDTEKSTESDAQVELRTLNVNMPTVQNGILKFTSKQHLSDFIDETISMDDDERIVFENSIGFTSLYRVINAGDNGQDVGGSSVSLSQPLVRNGITVFERNSPYQIVFNQHHELWVGNHIYKYVGENLCVRTTSPYLTDILDIRNNPDKIVKDNTELIDFVRDSVITVKPRTACQMIVRNPYESTGTKGYVQVDLIDFDGVKHTGICGGIVTINWGDGTTTSEPNNSNVLKVWGHTYPMPPLSTCITHTVTFTVEFNSSSLCSFYNKCSGSGPLVFTGTTTITICNPNTCTPFEDDQPETLISSNVYNNGNNAANFYYGYDLENTWFKEPKAWGRIIHHNKDGNGWKRVKPNIRTEIHIYGTSYRGSCYNPEQEDAGNDLRRKANHIKTHILDSSSAGSVPDYYLRTDNRLFVDFRVHHLNAPPASPDVQLLAFPFY
ncbi:MAG: hypothetical protein U0T36_11850 [Saprospiraceae bacterium]